MTVSVVEIAESALATNTSKQATISTTPVAGDVIYALVTKTNSSTVSLAGCGATWSQLFDINTAGTSAQNYAWWVGENPNAAGTITATLGTSRSGIIRVFVARGVSSPTNVVAADCSQGTIISTGTSSATAPSHTAHAGDLVIGVETLDASSLTTPFSATTPGSGWTSQTSVAAKVTAYRIPAGDETVNHTVSTTSSSTKNYGIGTLIVGPAAGSTSGTASAALGALTAAASGVRTAFGTVAAALGAMVGLVTGTRTTPGTAAAAFGGLDGEATGARFKDGTADAALGALTASAAGVSTVSGTAAAALGGLTAAVSGDVTSDVTLDLPVLNINLTVAAPTLTTNVTLGLPCLRIKIAAPAPRVSTSIDPTFVPPPPLPTVIGAVYDRDGTTRIDRLRNIDAVSWREVVRGTGQASFQVPLDDDSTAQITDRRVVKLHWLIDGQVVATFACRIRAEGSVVKQLAVDGRRWVRFENMPGSLDFLADDVVWPQQALADTDAATRWFGFMSGEDDWYVPEDWGTPHGQAWSDTADTFRNKLPPDFRGVDRDAEWISTIGPTTTQPEFDFNYFRGTLTVDADTEIEILYTVDNFLWFYIDDELVVNVPPPGRGQWRNGYTLNTRLAAGDRLFAARVQNSRFSLVQGANPIAFICTVRALNSDGSVNKDLGDNGVLFHTDTTSWLAHGDAPEPGWHRAQVLLKVIDEGKAHSAGDPTGNGLTYLRLGFDGDTDSDGDRWTDRGSYELDVGTLDLAGVAVKLADRFMDVWVDPHDMRLHAFTRMGRDRRDEIRLRYGWDPDQAGTILDAEVSVKGVQYNSVLTQLPIIRWLQTDRSASIASVGRVVAGINAAPLGTLGSGGFVADQLLDDGAAQLSSVTVKSSTLEGKLPYVDYDLGDTITIPGRRGLATAHRALAFNVVGPTKDQPVVQAWAEFMEDQSD